MKAFHLIASFGAAAVLVAGVGAAGRAEARDFMQCEAVDGLLKQRQVSPIFEVEEPVTKEMREAAEADFAALFTYFQGGGPDAVLCRTRTSREDLEATRATLRADAALTFVEFPEVPSTDREGVIRLNCTMRGVESARGSGRTQELDWGTWEFELRETPPTVRILSGTFRTEGFLRGFDDWGGAVRWDGEAVSFCPVLGDCTRPIERNGESAVVEPMRINRRTGVLGWRWVLNAPPDRFTATYSGQCGPPPERMF